MSLVRLPNPSGTENGRTCTLLSEKLCTCSLDNNLALHSGSLVRLAVVAVLAGLVELDLVCLTGSVEIVFPRKGLGVHSLRHVVLVEDDVVGEAGVVRELNRFAGFDGDRVWDEHKA